MAPFVLTRRRAIGLIAAVALLGAGLVFQPLALRVARGAAERRGWSIQAREATLGMRGVWLKHVEARRGKVPDLNVKFDAVLLPWGRLITRGALILIGGDVQLPAHLDSLRQELTTTGGSEDRRQVKSTLALHLVGINVSWQGAPEGGTSLFAWGLSGDISSAKATLKLDRIEISRASSTALFLGAAVAAIRADGDWTLQTAKSDRAEVAIQSQGRVRAEATSPLAAGTPSRTPTAHRVAPDVSASKASPDALEKLASALSGLQATARKAAGWTLVHVSAGASITIPAVSMRWSHGEQSLNIGPFELQAHGDADRFTLTMAQGAQGTDERRFFEVNIPKAPSHVDLKGEIGFVSLQALGVKEADFGLEHVDAAKLKLNVAGVIDEVASSATLSASGELLDVSLRQPWLASRTVTGINAEFSGRGDLNWQSGFALQVHDLSLKVGQARLDVTSHIERRATETRAKLDVDVPLAACGALVESLPTGLAPLASQVTLEGTLALHAGIVFDTAHPNQTDAQWDLANGCRVRGSSTEVSPERFREPFILEVPDARGIMGERAFGPGTANWVPLSAMTTHLADAILVCEDGRFYNHRGFDAQAIRASIKDNLLRGRFMRGGSTVSMQLAKNLYLRREKTVSRKLQEAVLTLLLEQSFSKNDIMELYLNVVELGPGIYGVGDAAKFYFNTTADALSIAQTFYLTSVLPNPKTLHFGADGRISRGWLAQIRRLMSIANSRHYLTDDELHQALEEDLRFGSSEGALPASATPANANVQGEETSEGPSDG